MAKGKTKTVKEVLENLEEKGRNVDKTKIIFEKKGKIVESFYVDLINALKADGWEIVKHFERISITPMATGAGPIVQRLTTHQDRVTTLGKTIGEFTRTAFTIFNDIMKLEQLVMLINQYKNAKDESEKSSALKRLKQYWAMKVDPAESGAGSIDSLAARYGMAVLRDAFYAVDSIKEAEKLDINERVKRILLIKLRSFFNWLELSMDDAPRRLNLLRKSLKQHIQWIKTYIEWMKPYLRVTKALRFFRPDRPDILELLDQTLITSGFFAFKEIKFDNQRFLICVYILVDEISKTRGVPVRPAGETVVRYGTLEVTMKCYAINDKEKKNIIEAIKSEEERIVEEELGSAIVDMVREMEDYLKEMEKKTKKYYEKLLGVEERKEEKKKESFIERLKKETEFIGMIIEFFEKIGKKKEKKEEKKEEEKEYEITDTMKRKAREVFTLLKIAIKEMVGGLFIRERI